MDKGFLNGQHILTQLKEVENFNEILKSELPEFVCQNMKSFSTILFYSLERQRLFLINVLPSTQLQDS